MRTLIVSPDKFKYRITPGEMHRANCIATELLTRMADQREAQLNPPLKPVRTWRLLLEFARAKGDKGEMVMSPPDLVDIYSLPRNPPRRVRS